MGKISNFGLGVRGGGEILLWGSCLSHTTLKLTAAGFQVSGHN